MMSISKKLLEAQKLATEVEKAAKNGHHNYFYATADSIVACGKQALNASGLSLVNTGYYVDREKSTVKGTFWLLDSDGDDKIELTAEMPFVPSNGRPDDKAVSASLTELRGYLMLGLLQIERVNNDPLDVAGRDDTAFQPQQQRQQYQERQAPPRQQEMTDDPGTCRLCGAPNKISQKTGKPYCSDKCWERQPAGAGNGRRF
jgi:hypothetical protein